MYGIQTVYSLNATTLRNEFFFFSANRQPSRYRHVCLYGQFFSTRSLSLSLSSLAILKVQKFDLLAGSMWVLDASEYLSEDFDVRKKILCGTQQVVRGIFVSVPFRLDKSKIIASFRSSDSETSDVDTNSRFGRISS